MVVKLKKILIKQVTFENCKDIVKEIVANIRTQDKDEMAYCGIDDLCYGLEHSVDYSTECYIATNDKGKILCVFGVSRIIHAEYGRPVWLIGTKDMIGYSKEFVIHSRNIIDRWLEKYGQLYNFVSETNTQSIRWLKSIGAVFYMPQKYGTHGEKISLFVLEQRGNK